MRNEIRLESGDADLPYREQRELVIYPDGSNWVIDCTAIDAAETIPVVFTMEKHSYICMMLESFWHAVKSVDDRQNYTKREDQYWELEEELNAWNARNGITQRLPVVFGSFNYDVTQALTLEGANGNYLIIFMGGNGDWYIQTSKTTRSMDGFRLVLSGGDSWRYSGISTATANIYHSIHSLWWKRPTASYGSILKEVQEYRTKFPKLKYQRVIGFREVEPSEL